MTAKIFCLILMFSLGQAASATLCFAVRNSKVATPAKDEVTFYETLFADNETRGSATWNEGIVECNRKRDTKGDELSEILNNKEHEAIKGLLSARELPSKFIKGEYNFYGKAVTRQKYRYFLSRQGGVWQLTIPYLPEINDIVKDRIDLDASHTANLYELAALDPASATSGPLRLLAGSRPIRDTLCATPTFFEGKEKSYKDMFGDDAHKRDRANKHISLGKIEFAYRNGKDEDNKPVFIRDEGCRVKKGEVLLWKNTHASGAGVIERITPEDFVFKNFIQTAEKYWSIDGVFTLKIFLKGFNDDEYPDLKSLKTDDFLKIRFGTTFLAYGGNQVYKVSPIQFNNFSTMTDNGTYWHEVGHALGLDDEYGKEKKIRNCLHEVYSTDQPETYQMCNVGVASKRTIYHYLATSRYVLASVCKVNGDCGAGLYCGKRGKINVCLPDATVELDGKCASNKECRSGLCDGKGDEKLCKCKQDKDCPDGTFCRNTTGQNECLADGTKALGLSCDKDRECKSGFCEGSGGDQKCACKQDKDCTPGTFCKNTLGKNLCLADRTKSLGQSCDKDRECSSGFCEGTGSDQKCACKRDADCSTGQRCKKKAFSKNICE